MIDAALVLQAVDAVGIGVFVCNLSGTVVYASPGFLRITGFNEDELVGNSISTLTVGEMSPDYHARLHQVIDGGMQWRAEISNRRKDGTPYRAVEIMTPILSDDGTVTAIAGVQHDITDAGTLRKQLEDHSLECDAVFSNTLDILFLVDVQRDGFFFRKLSRSHLLLVGITATDVVGKTPQAILGPERGAFHELQFSRCINDGTPHTYEEMVREDRILETRITPIYHGEIITQLVGSTRDVPQQKGLERELRYLEEMDMLTNIPNRRKTSEELDRELSRAQRHNRALAVLLIDVDHFKSINDDLGHDYGDAALRQIATTLEASLRPSDRVGRWGGEEFVAILPETGRDGALIAAERVRTAVETAHIVDGRVVTVSIGFCAIESSERTGSSGLGHSPESLVRVADEELSRAKDSGRNRVSG